MSKAPSRTSTGWSGNRRSASATVAVPCASTLIASSGVSSSRQANPRSTICRYGTKASRSWLAGSPGSAGSGSGRSARVLTVTMSPTRISSVSGPTEGRCSSANAGACPPRTMSRSAPYRSGPAARATVSVMRVSLQTTPRVGWWYRGHKLGDEAESRGSSRRRRSRADTWAREKRVTRYRKRTTTQASRWWTTRMRCRPDNAKGTTPAVADRSGPLWRGGNQATQS